MSLTMIWIYSKNYKHVLNLILWIKKGRLKIRLKNIHSYILYIFYFDLDGIVNDKDRKGSREV